jgi:hypothetical protein
LNSKTNQMGKTIFQQYHSWKMVLFMLVSPKFEKRTSKIELSIWNQIRCWNIRKYEGRNPSNQKKFFLKDVIEKESSKKRTIDRKQNQRLQSISNQMIILRLKILFNLNHIFPKCNIISKQLINLQLNFRFLKQN